MKFVSKHILSIVGIALGAAGGFLYWKYVGCDSGTCPITSKPLNSTAYGAMMGFLFLNIFKPSES